MQFRNLTPHTVMIQYRSYLQVLEPEKKPVRVSTSIGEPFLEIDGVEILEPGTKCKLQNLPAETPDCMIVVSQLCALVASQLHPKRRDIIYPAVSKYNGGTKQKNGLRTVSKFIMAN